MLLANSLTDLPEVRPAARPLARGSTRHRRGTPARQAEAGNPGEERVREHVRRAISQMVDDDAAFRRAHDSA